MIRLAAFFLGLLSLALGAAAADDGRGLKRSADPSDITISGLSSGAAMAVQYAVAHSSSVVGATDTASQHP
jgi:poly(3-hydroxybutyrate) depolymerase